MSKRNNALLWTGIGAAAAGIVAVVTILKLHDKEAKQTEQHERDINAVIADCYRKINEIEAHLPTLQSPPALPRSRKPSQAGAANN